MSMFWEFFTFELKFRAKSISTYVYFLLLVRVLVLLRRLRELRPGGQRERQGAAQRAVREHVQRHRREPVRRDHHRRDLRHVDPARFPARHVPDAFHEADLEVRLSRRPLGGLVRDHACSRSRGCCSARGSARSRRGPITRASGRIISGGTSSRSCRSSSSRSSFSARCSSRLPRSRRKIFVVYLQGVALFMIYIDRPHRVLRRRGRSSTSGPAFSIPSGSSCSTTSRATGRWSRRTRCSLPWDFSGNSPGVFLYNRLLWTRGGLALARRRVGALPDVGGGAHGAVAGQARGEGAAAGRPRRRARPRRSWRRACRACASCSAARTTFTQYLSLSRLRIRTSCARSPSGRSSAC